MCRLRNIAMRDYQESVTTGQTDGRTDRQTPDKVIPMCRYASQAAQIQHCTCIYMMYSCMCNVETSINETVLKGTNTPCGNKFKLFSV